MYIIIYFYIIVMIIAYSLNKNISRSNNLDLNFSKKFLFGAATSSYQNEGSNNNNWTRWEKINNLESCNKSCDMWNCFDEEIKNMKKLNLNMFRFSIEWSRIEIKQDIIDNSAIEKYKNWCLKLKKNEIEPVVTLYHFTLPIWIDDIGGWENPLIITYFENYVKNVAKILGPHVKYWITINEPFIECLHGWLLGTRPPGKNFDTKGFFLALKHMCIAHAKAYHILHKFNNECMVSISKNLSVLAPYSYLNPIDILLTNELNKLYNKQILESLITGHLKLNFMFKGVDEEYDFMKGTLDYIGVNHYNKLYVHFLPFSKQKLDVLLWKENDGYSKNQLGWSMVPDSMYYILKKLQKYKLPILITENGACGNDSIIKREDYLINCLNCIKRSINEGNNIIGYNYWTLSDNFEWEDGYNAQFGLYSVNFKTQKRILTNCGKLYKLIITNH
jgi:beta-glucosidase